MTAASDYAHELYSNPCYSSRLDAGLLARPKQNRGWLLFEERVDLSFGVLDKLLAIGVLNEVEYIDVKASQLSILGWKKLNEYMELAKNKSANVLVAFTEQQHLLNYAWNSGTYNPEFGGEWPLTYRQMTILNINQEILLELMEMSPEFIEQLYSRNVLNRRHKDFIRGLLSELKKSETFLDILRRRSFRDYKETIKCLRKCNQKHIADILEGGTVIRITCTLRSSKRYKMNRSTTETVVKRFSEQLNRQPLDGEDKKLQLTNIGLIGVKFDNAIVLYFKCKTNNDLLTLETIFDKGEMKAIVESDIRNVPVLSRVHGSITAILEWSLEDSIRCDTYIRRRPFRDTCTQDLHMEVLEIILTKAYALYFYRVHPRPRDKELFELLASVSKDWLKTIARRLFKASLNRRLYLYFHMVNKRNIIIRCNQKYLNQNMESTDILINRLEQFGCISRKEAEFVSRLQHNTERNQELLNILRLLSLKRHDTFIECLHFCGQLKVAAVIEKGGVVLRANAICAAISKDGDFIQRLNENIYKTQREDDALQHFKESFGVEIPKELEILNVQILRSRKGNKCIVIWLWCKTHKAFWQIRELKESIQLFKLLDILMAYIWSEETDNLFRQLGNLKQDKLVYVPQFLKTLSLDPTQFQREVAVRQLSPMFCGEFNLGMMSPLTLTSLDDKLYVLMEDGLSIHQCLAPYVCVSKVLFPADELSKFHPDHGAEQRLFLEACNQTKCLYVSRRRDRRVWKFNTRNNSFEVWMHYKATLSSLSVASNGDVLVLKFERIVSRTFNNDYYVLEIYTKDAVLARNVILEIPLPVFIENISILDVSSSNFIIRCPTSLMITNSSTTDHIRYPHNTNYSATVDSIAKYHTGRLIAIMSNQLAIFDSQLNVEILDNFNSLVRGAFKLHYRKDKRQLMVWSPGQPVARICNLVYAGEAC